MGERAQSRVVDSRWRWVGLAGMVVWVALLGLMLTTAAESGLNLLWYLFIPLAPMILLVAPGVWVSACPISSFQSETGGFFQRRQRLSGDATSWLRRAAWFALFLGVPTRHLLFNTSGHAMFGAGVVVTVIAMGFGVSRIGLAGWCAGACPIRPVEVMYGQWAVDRRRPTPCSTCSGCAPTCTRSRPKISGVRQLNGDPVAGHLALAFPGLVASYFLLDGLAPCTGAHAGLTGSAHVAWIYGIMASAALGSWVVGHWAFALSSDDEWVLPVAALSAYCAYYLGITPEIVAVWSLPSATMGPLLIAPAAVLVFVVWRRQQGVPPSQSDSSSDSMVA